MIEGNIIGDKIHINIITQFDKALKENIPLDIISRVFSKITHIAPIIYAKIK